MNEWKTLEDKLPEDGAFCEIIIDDTEKGIGMLCAFVKDKRFIFPGAKDMDITEYVIKWHRVPIIIVGEDHLFHWSNE